MIKNHYRKQPEKIPKLYAWFLIITGILMGTVFSVGMHYWESSVSKEEAIYMKATFSSYEKIYNRYGLKEIKVCFQDRNPLFVDSTCCSQTVQDKLMIIEPGTIFQMYVHPNASTLLEIKTDNDSILCFEDSIEKLSSEVSGFLFLGIFMYLIAGYGLKKLARKETY